jgi:ABC-2 type transport system permease protein
MRITSVIKKSFKEQMRNFWIVLLSLSMGPFFIFVYYLITQSSNPQYKVQIVNTDTGILLNGKHKNSGEDMKTYFYSMNKLSDNLSFIVSEVNDRKSGIENLKNKDCDALIVIPPTFSESINASNNINHTASKVEFIGDLTSSNYLISAVWANEIVNEYSHRITKNKKIIEVNETPLGSSGKINEFDMLVPGILIVSLIMLMFTASIAFVSEVEHKTIMRLKLSKLKAFEFLCGIGFVQFMIGIASVLLTLVTAILLGFQYQGSLFLMLTIAGITCLSIISFSLIIAAITKSANEVLVVGNFPMFLFMFFTGAAFPIKSDALFAIAGYPINIQGFLSPTHAISALNKIFVMNMNIASIVPEIISILVLTLLYFTIGASIYNGRHLKI